MPGALGNITVLDLTHVLAGPFCTYQLGLLGADVIKIENPHDPDCARGRGPDAQGNAKGLGLTYQVQGGNKRSLALDLSTPSGRDILLKLARGADVVVDNFATGALDRLGVGYAALSTENPALVHCSITGFGATGPKAAHGAYDNTIQAASGVVTQCGGTKPGVSFVDYATGYAAAFAVTSALVQSGRSGQGTHISVSMLEVAMQMMAPEAAAAQYHTRVQREKEAGISSYDTAQGVLLLGAFRPSQYRRLGRFLAKLGHDVPALSDIHDWPEVWAIDDATRSMLRAVFETRTADDWVALLHEADLPSERVQTLSEAIEAPQLQHRGFFQANPAAPDTLLPKAAFAMSNGDTGITLPPPALGAHTQEILASVGISVADIERLFAKGVVA